MFLGWLYLPPVLVLLGQPSWESFRICYTWGLHFPTSHPLFLLKFLFFGNKASVGIILSKIWCYKLKLFLTSTHHAVMPLRGGAIKHCEICSTIFIITHSKSLEVAMPSRARVLLYWHPESTDLVLRFAPEHIHGECHIPNRFLKKEAVSSHASLFYYRGNSSLLLKQTSPGLGPLLVL